MTTTGFASLALLTSSTLPAQTWPSLESSFVTYVKPDLLSQLQEEDKYCQHFVSILARALERERLPEYR